MFSDKRVFIFEDSSFSRLGGGQVVTITIIRCFNKLGYDVILCDHNANDTFHNKVKPNLSGFFELFGKLNRGKLSKNASNFPPIMGNLSYIFIFFFNIIRFVFHNKKFAKDTYYSATRHSHIFCFFLCLFRNRYWIAHVHSNEKNPILRKLMRYIFKKSNKIIFVSNYLQEYYDLEEATVLYNPIDGIKQKENNFKKNGICNVGFVGNLLPWKGIDIFLNAAQILNSRNTKNKFSFFVFGGGENLENLRKLYPFISFKGVTKREIIYPQIDILVLPSVDAESCPMVILEAIKSGTVCITTNFGGQSELVKRFGGVLIEPNSISAIEEAIIYVNENYVKLKSSFTNIDEILNEKSYLSSFERLICD